MKTLRKGMILVLISAAVSTFSWSQTVDTVITGTITDNTGAVIPGAAVTVVNEGTQIAKATTTNATGSFTVNYLIPGTYDIHVKATGFANTVRTGIILQVNQQVKLTMKMTISSLQQVVQVQATQPLLQTQSASIGLVVGPTNTVNLPLNGRKFDDLAVLTPGVTTQDPDNHSSSTAGSSINAYGEQVTWGQTNVDGVSMVNNRHAYVNIFPSVDAVQEFDVLTGDYPAEYAGGAGSVVNIQLKSGTNQFHGDIFEFLRNPVLDARNYFRPAPLAKQVLKQNQFGGTVGGPILKDKAFFFLSYEGLRSVQDLPATAFVLTPAEINGDFSALLPNIQLVSPFTGQPYKDNQIPVDPVAQSMAQKYMPGPDLSVSTGNPNYAGEATGFESVNQYIVRLDDSINAKNQLALHFIYAFRNFPDSALDPNFTFTGTYPGYNVGLQWIHTFSPRLLNEFRAGTDLEHVKQLSTRAYTNFTPESIGINGFVMPNGQPWPPADQGFPIVSIAGFIPMGDGTAASNLDASGTYQMVDNVTWTRGRHTLIMGTDIRHAQDNATTDNDPYGALSFTGVETGYAAADFMLGIPSSIITPEGVPLTAARQWRDFAYVQDDWKVTSNLTANLGLQYALWVPPHDNLNTSRELDFFTNPPTIVNLPDPLWHITHKDFAPRVGFAYSLPRQFVVRAAYGISFYGGQFDNINILQLNPPADPSFTLVNGHVPSNPPTATIQYPVSPSLKAQTANVVSDPMHHNHPDLYLQTYNLTVSKQFWSNVLNVSYVGVKGTHEDTSNRYWNAGPPQPFGRPVVPNNIYPTFGIIRLVDYEGASIYNALDVQFEHRMSHGLDLTASYAWSHEMDNQGGDTNGPGAETQTHAKEWANGLTDIPNYLTLAFVWELPKIRGGMFAERALLNGWGFNSIFQAVSGSPLWITQAPDGENNGNSYQRPDLEPGQKIRLAHRTVSEWFNTGAFTEAIGHYGSTPRNPVGATGPFHDPLTLAVVRDFTMPFNEGQRLELRMEGYNILNHPQFGNPGTAAVSSSFGIVSSTTIDNREFQAVAKYYF